MSQKRLIFADQNGLKMRKFYFLIFEDQIWSRFWLVSGLQSEIWLFSGPGFEILLGPFWGIFDSKKDKKGYFLSENRFYDLGDFVFFRTFARKSQKIY